MAGRLTLAIGIPGLALLGSVPSSIAQPVPAPSLIRPPLTIKCPNGVNYRLTTGSDTGACKLYVEHGRILGGICTDGSNTASQTCATGCKETTGSGVCEQAAQAGDDSS